MQKTVQEVQANTGSSISSVTQTTQGLSDNLQEVQARVGKLSQQMTDVQNLLQSIDAKVSGGVSNISFSFRGNNKVREAMHSAFLYHAIGAGLDMGIVNAGMLEVYEQIEPHLKELVEDVLLNRRPDASERLLALAERYRGHGKERKEADTAWREWPAARRRTSWSAKTYSR